MMNLVSFLLGYLCHLHSRNSLPGKVDDAIHTDERRAPTHQLPNTTNTRHFCQLTNTLSPDAMLSNTTNTRHFCHLTKTLSPDAAPCYGCYCRRAASATTAPAATATCSRSRMQ